MELASERFPPALSPQQASWADPASVAEKVCDSEESKVGSEERRGAERSRMESEPSAPPKDSKQTELPTSRSSFKGEPPTHFSLLLLFYRGECFLQ